MTNQEYDEFIQTDVAKVIATWTQTNTKPCFTVIRENDKPGTIGSRYNSHHLLVFHMIDPKADTTQLEAVLGAEGMAEYNRTMEVVSHRVLIQLRNDPIIMHQISRVIASFEFQEPTDEISQAIEEEANAILHTELAQAIIGSTTKAMADE